MVSLTVVTVVRDDALGLHETMNSLSEQTRLPDQVVVNDSSRDRAAVPAVCTKFPALPVDLAWHPPSGVYGAMNQALEMATGDFVYFLNAGDVLADPTVVSDVVARLQEAQPLWALGAVVFRGEDGTPLREPTWSYATERRHLFARGRFPAHQGVVVRTDALRDMGGFDESYRVAADYASILRLASWADPIELGFPLAIFTTGGLSTQEWRTALTEFHRARLQAFRPRGGAALAESAHTLRTRVSTEAYRALWAPGRPLAGLVARGRALVSR